MGEDGVMGMLTRASDTMGSDVCGWVVDRRGVGKDLGWSCVRRCRTVLHARGWKTVSGSVVFASEAQLHVVVSESWSVGSVVEVAIVDCELAPAMATVVECEALCGGAWLVGLLLNVPAGRGEAVARAASEKTVDGAG